MHPLAIEAGLLHALAAMGCGAEAVERWGAIVEDLPLGILFENLCRISACFPADAPEGQLDELVNRRLAREEQEAEAAKDERPRRGGVVKKEEVAAAVLFTGLDAAQQAKLMITHRAMLGQVAHRFQGLEDPSDLLRFLTEYVVPLANRGLERSAQALGRAATKRLLVAHADAMVLHRAMQKLQMAGDQDVVHDVATLLTHWRQSCTRVNRARHGLQMAVVMIVGGGCGLAYVLWPMGVLAGKTAEFELLGQTWKWEWVGPAIMVAGAVLGLAALMGRTWNVMLPYGRRALTREELAYLRQPEVKANVRGAMKGRRR